MRANAGPGLLAQGVSAWPLRARRRDRPLRPWLPPAGAGAGTADATQQIPGFVRLYRLIAQTIPDRPGLRHHADLLAAGHTLAGLAHTLLTLHRPAPDAAARDRAATLWARDGRPAAGFAAAWRAAPDLAHFAAMLAAERSQPAAILDTLFPAGIDPLLDDVYPAWAYRLWSAEIERRLTAMARRLLPLLRVAGPCFRLTLTLDATSSAEELARSLSSLERQVYGRFRLRIDGALPAGAVLRHDPRIGPHRPTRRACLHATLRAGDTLSPACLALFAYAALRRPGVDRWSCDQDHHDPGGFCAAPRLDLLRRDGLIVTRKAGATPADAARHLPAALLHRGQARARGVQPAIAAGDVIRPSVSVVIATRDKAPLLRACIDGLRRTDGPPPELVIVDNGSVQADAVSLLAELERQGCVVLRRPGPFNWSLLNNRGVRASSGDVVVLLNNDIECIDPAWLDHLVRACLDPAVGAAGARLLYPDGTLQHAGVLIGPGARAAHRWSEAGERGIRPVSAVTGACMAFRRSVFDRLGGLDEALPVTWNDLDFCLRARAAGLDVVLCSDSVLRHHELGTRTPDSAPENQAQLARTRSYVARRHRQILEARDRFSHPAVTLDSGGRLLDSHAWARISALIRGGGVD